VLASVQEFEKHGCLQEFGRKKHLFDIRSLPAVGLDINRERTTLKHPALMTVADLTGHYDSEELGERRLSKTQGTVDVYREFLKYWIIPPLEGSAAIGDEACGG
jgi:hypothetical protein